MFLTMITYQDVLLATMILISILTVASLVLLLLSFYSNNHLKSIIKSLRHQLSELLEVTKSGIWEWKASTNQIHFDETVKQLLNIKNLPTTLSMDSWIDLTDETFGKRFKKEFDDILRGVSPTLFFDFDIKDQDHKHRYFRCYGKVMRKGPNGEVQWMVGIINDITLEVTSNQDAMSLNNLLRNVIESSSTGVVIFDTNINYLYVSDVFKKLFGFDDTIIGKNHYEMIPAVSEHYKEAHKRCLKGETVTIKRDVIHLPDDRFFYVNWTCKPWYEQEGKIGGLISNIEIINDQVEKEIQLEYASTHDGLTGLLNRTSFIENLAKLDVEKKYPITIILVDINGFKIINDAYGFEHADQVLLLVRDQLKPFEDTFGELYRIAGNTFAFISSIDSVEEIKALIRNIHEHMTKINYLNVTPSVSIGYFIKTDESISIEQAFKEAETELYRRKILNQSSLQNTSIRGIIQTLNEKYKTEKDHSFHVQKLAKLMGQALNFDKEDMNELYFASLLHDIGKIAIPDAVLNKTGKLTDEEFKIMKTHTEIGYKILKAADGYSDLARYALTHHERMDGKGYPQGLKGNEIPLISRIITICDSYEAMTANRPYRKALTKEAAIDELIKHSGTQFDEKLVKIFIEQVVPKDN